MAKAMTIQKLATVLCKRVGNRLKKSRQVDRGQMLEILAELADMEAEQWVKSAGFLHRGTPLGALDHTAQKKYNARIKREKSPRAKAAEKRAKSVRSP